MTTSTGFPRRRCGFVALACFIVILDASTLIGEEAKPSAAEAKPTSDQQIQDAIEKVRTHLNLENAKWELKGFLSKNNKFTVVHDLHRLPSHKIMLGEHVALVDVSSKVLWAKRTKFHWPIVVGDEGTVALPQWEERAKSRPKEGPSAKDGLHVKLFDTTGKELASCPLGRFLDTNALIQPWVLEERMLFVGTFSRGDKAFYFATRARPKLGGHPLYPEIHRLQRDGQLDWRYPLKNLMPNFIKVVEPQLGIIGEAESDGQRVYVRLDTRPHGVLDTRKIPAGYKIPWAQSSNALLPPDDADN